MTGSAPKYFPIGVLLQILPGENDLFAGFQPGQEGQKAPIFIRLLLFAVIAAFIAYFRPYLPIYL
jgi:hypothetical protein